MHVAVDRFLVAARPAAVLVTRGDGTEECVSHGRGHHFVAADRAVFVEYESEELCGAGERFEGVVVDMGAVDQLRPTPVAHLGGLRDGDELRPVAFLGHDRGVSIGISGDAVHVVDVEPAHIP